MLRVLAVIMIGLLMLGFVAFSTAYIVDGLREVFVEGRIWLLLLVFFGAPILVVLYWSAVVAGAPVAAMMEGNWKGLLLLPVGLGIAYVLWRVSNWLVYGLLGFEPWAYNFFFGWLGLAR